MTEDEYLNKLDDLLKHHKNLKFKLAREYTESLSDVKAGDTITDGNHTIIVAKTYPMTMFEITPNAYFEGVWLTKKGHKNKREEITTLHYSDKIRILKKGNCK